MLRCETNSQEREGGERSLKPPMSTCEHGKSSQDGWVVAVENVAILRASRRVDEFQRTPFLEIRHGKDRRFRRWRLSQRFATGLRNQRKSHVHPQFPTGFGGLRVPRVLIGGHVTFSRGMTARSKQDSSQLGSSATTKRLLDQIAQAKNFGSSFLQVGPCDLLIACLGCSCKCSRGQSLTDRRLF